MASDGRYKVTIGESFFNDEESFHSFKYSFIPESANTEAPAFLSQEDKGSHWILSLQNSQGPEYDPHELKSVNTKSKELDCVLVYHPDSNTYALERLDSSFHFQPIRNTNTASQILHRNGDGTSSLYPDRPKRGSESPARSTKYSPSHKKPRSGGDEQSPPALADQSSPAMNSKTMIVTKDEITAKYNGDESDLDEDEFDLDQIVAETISNSPEHAAEKGPRSLFAGIRY